MTTRQILIAVPEGPHEGVPADGENGIVVTVLPEGTYRLILDASWQVTEDGGKFRGGTASFGFEFPEAAS